MRNIASLKARLRKEVKQVNGQSGAQDFRKTQAFEEFFNAIEKRVELSLIATRRNDARDFA